MLLHSRYGITDRNFQKRSVKTVYTCSFIDWVCLGTPNHYITLHILYKNNSMKTILLTCITNTLYIQHTKSEKAKYFYLVHSLIPVTGLSAVVLWDRVQVRKLCNINKIIYHYVLRLQSKHGHTFKCYSCLDITVNEVQIGIPEPTSTFF